jgi:hypothetical protein
MAEVQTLVDVEGVVKWFDARKGFGFIVCMWYAGKSRSRWGHLKQTI